MRSWAGKPYAYTWIEGFGGCDTKFFQLSEAVESRPPSISQEKGQSLCNGQVLQHDWLAGMWSSSFWPLFFMFQLAPGTSRCICVHGSRKVVRLSSSQQVLTAHSSSPLMSCKLCSHARKGDSGGGRSVVSVCRSLSSTILVSIPFLVPSLDNLLEIQGDTSSSTFVCPASLSQHANELIHNVFPFIVDLACTRLQMFAKRRSLVENLFAGTTDGSGLSDVKAIVDRVMSCEFVHCKSSIILVPTAISTACLKVLDHTRG